MYTTTQNQQTDPTSDANIKKDIEQVLENLKTQSPKFYATYRKEIVKEFNSYEDAIAYLSIHPHVKVFVR